MATTELQFDAHTLQSAASNGAPLSLADTTNQDIFVRAFDDSTEEFVQGKFRAPADLSGTDTVTVTVAVAAKTPVTGKNVKHTFGHAAIANGEDFDAAHTNVSVDDQALEWTSGEDDISIHTIVNGATATTLGWTAGDLVLFRYSRPDATTNDLSGDMYLLHLNIKISN